MNEIEKMDELKKRFNISYEKAREVLIETGWNLEDAVVKLEGEGVKAGAGEGGSADGESTKDVVNNIIDQIKGIIQEGNVTKVRLKRGEQTLIEIPATIGVVGLGIMLFSPLMLAVSAIGAVAAVSSEMIFEIEKKDGSIERRYLKWPQVVSEKDNSHPYEDNDEPEN